MPIKLPRRSGIPAPLSSVRLGHVPTVEEIEKILAETRATAEELRRFLQLGEKKR
jgi:hypothetical protein